MLPARARADACPGALSTHTADDGELARVRLPGGALSAAQLLVLAEAAVDLGDGDLHLTSRGNVQLRAVRDPGDLALRLAEAGLLPSATHERVRNILASPLPGVLDAVPLAGSLDRAVCADPVLADLPGRFLFAVDAGQGDVAGEDADVCWRAVDPTVGVLQLGGVDTGVLVPTTQAVDALAAVARAFLRVRGSAWRMRELTPDAVNQVGWSVFKTYQPPGKPSLTTTNLPEPTPPGPNLPEPTPPGPNLPEPTPPGPPPPGQHADAVVAATPLGVLTAAQARVLADVAPHGVLVTPWRTAVVRAASPGVLPALRAAGLVLAPDDPRALVSSCIGRPGCARARADVRADATRAIAQATRAEATRAQATRAEARARGRPTCRAHFAGCERRCGRPHGGAVDVLAVDDGYQVDGAWVPVDRLADSLLARAAAPSAQNPKGNP